MPNNFQSNTQSIQRNKGRVKAFDKSKGFGFIYGERGSRDIFVHYSDITDGSTALEVDEIVEFTLVEGVKGLRAKAVERTSQTTNNNSNNMYGHHRPVFPPIDRATKETYQDLREICTRIINDTLGVATEFERLVTPLQTQKVKSFSVDNLQNLSYRAESELLTIAFFGPFSAGKSFLISSLIGRLDWFSHPHMGKITDQYVPLIPGSPRPTSSCPLVIEPASQKEREDQFFVQFEENTLWERISPVLTPFIQAYVTDLPNAIGQRRPADRRRKVLKARLVITDTQIPARLYDLPGLGAIGNKFADLAYTFVQQADCIVYIASSEKPIGEGELELLRYVYEHHRATQKPVFFVLTQIDKHDDFDTASGQLVWEEVLKANNEFLGEFFRTDQRKPDNAFIGDGFIPVSAAEEAKGIKLLEAGNPKGKFHVETSRMTFFREKLSNYLVSTSGPIHLTEMVLETQRALTPLMRELTEQEKAEALPLDSVQGELLSKKQYRETLFAGQKDLQSELVRMGEVAIARAFSKSDPNDLWSLLKQKLADKILTQDILKEKVIHELEVEQANIIREWINRPTDGPASMWSDAWKSLDGKAQIRTIELLEKAKSAGQVEHKIGKAEVAEKIALIDRKQNKVQTTKDTIDVAAKAWPVIGGLGVGGVLYSVLGTGLAVLGPIGWAFIATASITGFFAKWRISQQRDERRQEMITHLDKLSQDAVFAYQNQARQVVATYIGNLAKVIDDEIEIATQTIKTLEQRLGTQENIDRSSRLSKLRELLGRTDSISNDINLFQNKFSQRNMTTPRKISKR